MSEVADNEKPSTENSGTEKPSTENSGRKNSGTGNSGREPRHAAELFTETPSGESSSELSSELLSGSSSSSASAPEAGTPRRRGLNQPWRGLVALVEVVVAVVAVLVSMACWHRGIVQIVSPLGGGRPPLVSTVFYGNWMSGAIGLGTVAAFLVVDAVRQLLLALRTRNRQRQNPEPDLRDDESAAEPATT